MDINFVFTLFLPKKDYCRKLFFKLLLLLLFHICCCFSLFQWVIHFERVYRHFWRKKNGWRQEREKKKNSNLLTQIMLWCIIWNYVLYKLRLKLLLTNCLTEINFLTSLSLYCIWSAHSIQSDFNLILCHSLEHKPDVFYLYFLFYDERWILLTYVSLPNLLPNR